MYQCHPVSNHCLVEFPIRQHSYSTRFWQVLRILGIRFPINVYRSHRDLAGAYLNKLPESGSQEAYRSYLPQVAYNVL